MKMPYTKALMKSIPKLSDPSHTRLSSIPGRPPDLVHPPAGCRFAPRCAYARDKCHEEEPPLVQADQPRPRLRLLVPRGLPEFQERDAELARVGGIPVGIEGRPDGGHRQGTPRATATTCCGSRTSSSSSRPGVMAPSRRCRASASTSAAARHSASSVSPGCGKSTTGRAIMQIPRPTVGHGGVRGSGPHRS